MTRMEMEDMLSSIRRLVSDKKPENPPESAGNGGLLLLTPALRVDPDADAESRPVDSGNLLAGGPDLVAAPDEADQTADVVEPDTLEPAQNSAPQTLESRIAELERAVVGSDEQWEPDGSEPQDIHEPELHVLEQYRERFKSLRLSDVAPVGDEADEAEAVDPATVAEIIAERTTDPIQETSADPEGTQGEVDQGPLQLADVAIFSHTPNPRQPATPEPPQQEAVAEFSHMSGADVVHADDDIFVDEELLRQVVSEIVRDELQGRLGERITRNVRRMVRQEIERALAMKSIK